jgi:hypothetical protein
MEWFKESEEVLHDISNGDITVDCLESGLIHPRTWEQVVEHNAGIQFWPHSSYPNLSSPEEPGYEQEANYESRVQYVINYFQNNGRGVLDFVGHSTHKKPVEFEITDDYERLPALEEIKRVTTSHYQNVPKREEGGEGKKTKLGPNDRVTETYLRINSQFLLNVLKSVVEYTIGGLDGVKFGLGPGLFCYPYKELYYHMPDMLKYKTDPEGLRKKHSTAFNQKCDDHIDLLLGYLTSQPQIPVKECMARWESKSSVVTFATFWLLIRPGTDVYVRENDESMNAYIVDSVQGGVSEEDGKKTNKDYQIGVWNLAYDGTQISPNLRTINISVFDNEREITSLPVFPVRFIDGVDGGKLKEKLVNRGKKYYEYSKHPSFLEYSGKGLKEGGKIVSLPLYRGY